jgi:hypothetical protein
MSSGWWVVGGVCGVGGVGGVGGLFIQYIYTPAAPPQTLGHDLKSKIKCCKSYVLDLIAI